MDEPQKKRRGRPRGDRPPLKPIATFRGNLPYRDWLNGFAAFMGLSQVDTMAESLERMAKDVGYDPPPERDPGSRRKPIR